jgi:hypothetical protein
MRDSIPLALVVALSLPGPGLSADDVQALTLGARLRVTVPSAGGLREGSLVALDNESLTLRLADRRDPWTVRRADVSKLAVSRGRGSRGKSALIGAGIGVGVAIVVGVASVNSHGIGPTGAGAGVLTAAYLVPLFSLGGLASRPAERWQEVPIQAIRLRPSPPSSEPTTAGPTR